MDWNNFINGSRIRESAVDGKREGMTKNTDKRKPFESDFGRVIFSAASRRLHDKTQVFPLTTDDNIHSRLTHSMEVMNIGHSFAINLSENKNFLDSSCLSENDILRIISPILKTSCLVHDIGNPPFGHFGEEVFQMYFKKLFNELRNGLKGNSVTGLAYDILSNIKPEQKSELVVFLNDAEKFADYECFDGNAEGMRVLTKLQYVGDLYGLNLTKATLAAALKYPNSSMPSKKSISVHKHGIFHTEKEYMLQVAKDCSLINGSGEMFRHPLAFLMEAADSICYLVMDIDDAISKKWVTYNDVKKAIERNVNIRQDVKDKLQENENIAKGAKKESNWVFLRTILLSHLMQVATNNFLSNLDKIECGIYDKELIEDGDYVYEALKKLFITRICNRSEIVSLEFTGQAVISGLLDIYLSMLFSDNKKVRMRAKSIMSKTIFKVALHEHASIGDPSITGEEVENLYERLDPADLSAEERFRIVRDYVAGMTDKFAVSQYQKLSGQRI